MLDQFTNVKIIFWGTPEFALPSLEALVAHNYRLAGVVTNPDERIGRKQLSTPPPVKVAAQKYRIPVFQPEKFDHSFKYQVLSIKADVFVVAAYGKIIPKEILNIPRYGALNIHPSLLPRWRGPAPIQFTILAGDAETGVTIIKMDEKMDHGPIVALRRLEITNYKLQITKFTYKELHERLAKLGAELLIETLPKWLRGEIKPVAQDESEATYSKILTKDDGRIKWLKPAEEIERMVRAFNPWPSAWTVWPRADRRLRLRIEESEIYEVEPCKMTESPGFVRQIGHGGIAVSTGRGNLIIKKLTLEGGKTMSVAEFLRGHPHLIGTTLM